MRWPFVLCGLLLLAGLAGTITRAELTDEQKKELFLKSTRENAHRRVAHPGRISHPAPQTKTRQTSAGEEEKIPHAQTNPRAGGKAGPHAAAGPEETPAAAVRTPERNPTPRVRA